MYLTCKQCIQSLCYPSCKVCSSHLKLIFFACKYSESSCKWTPSGRENGVHNCSCMAAYKNVEIPSLYGIRKKTGFCESVRKQSCPRKKVQRVIQGPQKYCLINCVWVGSGASCHVLGAAHTGNQCLSSGTKWCCVHSMKHELNGKYKTVYCPRTIKNRCEHREPVPTFVHKYKGLAVTPCTNSSIDYRRVCLHQCPVSTVL